MNTGWLLALAILPAVVLMVYIYIQDTHEKEPIGLLLTIFFLGVLSALPAIILEKLADIVINVTFGGTKLIYYAMTAFFGVAIIEEGVKFLAAYLMTWRNKHFNYKFDGIVYCLFGSMGFAAIENVLYLVVENMFSDYQSVLSMGIQRGFLAIPCHAMCGIFMGYYYGNAKYEKSYGRRSACRKNLFTGFMVACSLHAFYDFCLFTEMGLFLVLFFIFVVVADIYTFIKVLKAKKEDQKMFEAPQYRQYWTGPIADPYELYGGYNAPVYGGYAAPNSLENANIGTVQPGMSEYQPRPEQGMPEYQPRPEQGMPEYQPQQEPEMPEYQSRPEQGMPEYQPRPERGIPEYQPQQEPEMPRYQSQPGMPEYQPQSQQSASVSDQAGQGMSGYRAQNQEAARFIPPKERMISCPICGEANNFHAFYCKSCGKSLHSIPMDNNVSY